MSTKVFIKQYQSPGDILMLTSAVRDLKAYKPNWRINVHTSCPDLWVNNLNLSTAISEDEADYVIDSDYKHEINKSNQRKFHFSRAFTDHLSEALNINIPIAGHGPDIYWTPEELSWVPDFGHYWIINAGGKHDYTAKWWNPDHYQKVVDTFRGKIQFIQVGANGHYHPKLDGAVDMIGKTTIRQLMLLSRNALGVITPVSFLMHLTGNMNGRYGGLIPGIVLAGGREQQSWEGYDNHYYLSKVGAYKCCAMGACWKSKATEAFCEQEVNEKKTMDDVSICEDRVDLGRQIGSPSGICDLKIARCMQETTPQEVCEIIKKIHDNRYSGSKF